MIDLLASQLGRNDEVPNIELARMLYESENHDGISEIAEGLQSGNLAIAHDCIKVLYEIGRSKPALIAEYTDAFITALSSKSNRMVWGGMTALAFVAPIKSDVLLLRLPEIIAAYKKGSTITIDNSISVLACLCKAGGDTKELIFSLLCDHLTHCRAKDIPQHAERMAVCIDSDNKAIFVNVLQARMDELTDSQKSRVTKLIRRVEEQMGPL